MTPVQRGWVSGISAHLIWAFFALYFSFLAPAGPVEVIVHRAFWALLACLAYLAIRSRFASLKAVWANKAVRYRLMLAGLLIAGNWSVYVLAVMTGRVVDAALGYFINPLVTAALAVIVLRERLTRLQYVALGLGAVAVLYMIITLGSLPWISLALPLLFGFYSLVKKKVANIVPPVPGMVIETATIVPPLLAYYLYLVATNDTSFSHLTSPWPIHLLLLIGAGVLTVIPLLLIARASAVLPLGVLGLVQYVGPIGQLIIGVVIFNESMSIHRWIATFIIWIALVVITIDGLRVVRISRLARTRNVEVTSSGE